MRNFKGNGVRGIFGTRCGRKRERVKGRGGDKIFIFNQHRGKGETGRRIVKRGDGPCLYQVLRGGGDRKLRGKLMGVLHL